MVPNRLQSIAILRVLAILIAIHWNFTISIAKCFEFSFVIMQYLLQSFENLQQILKHVGYSPISITIPLVYCKDDSISWQSIAILWFLAILIAIFCNIALSVATFRDVFVIIYYLLKSFAHFQYVLQHFCNSTISITIPFVFLRVVPIVLQSIALFWVLAILITLIILR